MRALYQGLLERLAQTTAQQTLGQLNARVVSDAVPPARPSGPRVKLILAAATLVGLALGSFAVLVARLFSHTVSRPAELERRTQVPILALVPELRKEDLR